MRRKRGQLVPFERSIIEAAMSLYESDIEDFYGYQLAKEIKERTGSRLLSGFGTLYRALDRLEQQGYLRSSWEDPDVAAGEHRPRRRFYQLTRLGLTIASRDASGRDLRALRVESSTR
jgi:DNA-binding PadR family transcriptional regulator